MRNLLRWAYLFAYVIEALCVRQVMQHSSAILSLYEFLISTQLTEYTSDMQMKLVPSGNRVAQQRRQGVPPSSPGECDIHRPASPIFGLRNSRS